MRTVPEILRYRARQQRDDPALWCEGRTTSYRALDERANLVADALVRGGLRPGQRVCVLDKGHDLYFETIFGIGKAGGVFTPVNWRLAPPEVAFVVDDAEAPFLFVGPDFAATVAQIEGDLNTVETIVAWGGAESGRGWTSYDDFLAGARAIDPRRDDDEEAAAWQLYTSGTTGHPKGAELTHANLCAGTAAGQLAFGGVRAGDNGLVCMPLYHIGGSGYALSLLYSGARLVILREPDPGRILELIEEQKIHHAFMVPALLNFLVQHPGAATTSFDSLRTLVYGASPIPEELLARCIEVFGCDFVQAYGLTETTGAAVTLAPRDHVVGSPRLRACGQAVFGCDLRVVRASGEECAANEVGEILIRGPLVMKGYWKRAEANAQCIRDGWFHSGDAGYLDEHGFLYIHDRVKDMIVSGAENVYPAEVESVLYAHPGVADVAVIGVPDEKWGEAVKAVVVRAAGSDVGESELIEFCRDRIAGYKRPRSVDFVDALPRNPTGKILKRELRARYWEGKARQVN
jgi:long-chain acyl-CoA synthetase